MSSDSVNDRLSSVREKFVKVRKLLDDDEKPSRESEPYKKKYEAIRVLKEMEKNLAAVLKDVPADKRENELVMLAIVHLNMGILHADTEELMAGEEQFTKCVEILKGKELEPKSVLPVLSALNQLGIIWSQWAQPCKAKEYLDQAEQIYKDFTDTRNVCRDPINMATNFGIEDAKNDLSSKDVLEEVHTLTLYYLAQVYTTLKDLHKSGVYCHMTLCRQLDRNDTMQNLDYSDWATNAAALSQYFVECNNFSQARYHLAAAFYVLQKYETILTKKALTNAQSEALDAEWENLRHRRGDIALCWAKYGILLLSASKERLLKKTEEDEQSDSECKDNTESTPITDLKFDVLEEHLEPIINQVTDQYALDFADAKAVFLNVQKWVPKAKTYYTLENHTSDYVKIQLDLSNAYDYLSFFVEDEDTQAEMHKRRIHLLHFVLKELNPQYYKAACRQLWTQLGTAYSKILDINLDRLSAIDKNPSAQALTTKKPNAFILRKLHYLAKNAIKYYQSYLDSLEMRNVNGIQQFPEDLMQVALVTYFNLGRLYNTIVTPDNAVNLENTQNSINAYRFVVDYCETYPKAAEVMKSELSLCAELVRLLSLKASMLRQKVTADK